MKGGDGKGTVTHAIPSAGAVGRDGIAIGHKNLGDAHAHVPNGQDANLGERLSGSGHVEEKARTMAEVIPSLSV